MKYTMSPITFTSTVKNITVQLASASSMIFSLDVRISYLVDTSKVILLSFESLLFGAGLPLPGICWSEPKSLKP